MLTFKERDGKNDNASNINRAADIFRLNLKISKSTFIRLFKTIPARPLAGGIVATGHDFKKLNEIMPHPVYGWMTWIGVLNPTKETIEKMESLHLFDEAYNCAVITFNKNISRKRSNNEVFSDQSDIIVPSVCLSTNHREEKSHDESHKIIKRHTICVPKNRLRP
jgi:hypothetical protein